MLTLAHAFKYYFVNSVFVMAFCGMITIMFRTAYLPVDGEEREYLEWKAQKKKEWEEQKAKKES